MQTLMPRPKMILFDFGNVIARVDNKRFITNLIGNTKIDVDNFVTKIFNKSNLSRDFETGRIDAIEFQQGVEKILGQNFTKEFFENAYIDIFEPILETFDLIREIKGKCRIGLLSNTNPIHFEKVFKQFDIFPLFDQFTLSYQVGAMKPSSKIFQDAIKKSGLYSFEILYLDDINDFVQAANENGINAIHFVDSNYVVNLIRKLFE